MPAPAFGPVLGRRDLLCFGTVGAASTLLPGQSPGTAVPIPAGVFAREGDGE
jgi:hypothetical protein